MPFDASRSVYFGEVSRLRPTGDAGGWAQPGMAENQTQAATSPPGALEPVWWSLAERPATVLDWARSAGWSTRSRLALPWRWGLLERAMRRYWHSSGEQA